VNVAIASATLVSLLTLADAGARDHGVTVVGKRPPCASVTAYVFVGAMGNNHVVTIANRCKKPVSCNVHTDVAPEPIASEVARGETIELVTFRGSPASEFRATVDCREM